MVINSIQFSLGTSLSAGDYPMTVSDSSNSMVGILGTAVDKVAAAAVVSQLN